MFSNKKDSIHDPKNIIGMGKILADEDDDEEAIMQIEQAIMRGVPAKLPVAKDIAKDSIMELDSWTNMLTKKTQKIAPPTQAKSAFSPMEDPFMSQKPTRDDEDEDDDDDEDKEEPPLFAAQPPPTQFQYQPPSSQYQPPSSQYQPPSSHYQPSAPPVFADPYLNRLTDEERKQSHINRVLSDVEDVPDEELDQEDDEDELMRMIEQISALRKSLEADGEDLSKIPEVTLHSSKKEARHILKILQIKNDRERGCDLIQELVLAGAYALEEVFDGEKEYFGKKIDLRGWSETVGVKLKRMRYNTSTFVANIMSKYDINPGFRLLIELIPSLILHSRNRRSHNRDNVASDETYRKAISDLS
jgi:hypothetical protein